MVLYHEVEHRESDAAGPGSTDGQHAHAHARLQLLHAQAHEMAAAAHWADTAAWTEFCIEEAAVCGARWGRCARRAIRVDVALAGVAAGAVSVGAARHAVSAGVAACALAGGAAHGQHARTRWRRRRIGPTQRRGRSSASRRPRCAARAGGGGPRSVPARAGAAALLGYTLDAAATPQAVVLVAQPEALSPRTLAGWRGTLQGSGSGGRQKRARHAPASLRRQRRGAARWQWRRCVVGRRFRGVTGRCRGVAEGRRRWASKPNPRTVCANIAGRQRRASKARTRGVAGWRRRWGVETQPAHTRKSVQQRGAAAVRRCRRQQRGAQGIAVLQRVENVRAVKWHQHIPPRQALRGAGDVRHSV
ncbi:hypothetical protein GGX14DRAFT_391685 [Mycena pura]|uniref:Uncharacterized protein n=1 Tax=Mycena pura TaxID=153505 RepID=A0AAD6VL31_9AGAR|nr:hypothetical protein GGX14DRAFT_391685 [Mycena pura]